jgi:hypothetical protein
MTIDCESILTSVPHAAKKAYFNNYKAIIIVRLQTTSKLLKMGYKLRAIN